MALNIAVFGNADKVIQFLKLYYRHCSLRRGMYWCVDGMWLSNSICTKSVSDAAFILSLSPPSEVNEVNGGDTVFVRCVSVCLCAADQSIRPV